MMHQVAQHKPLRGEGKGGERRRKGIKGGGGEGRGKGGEKVEGKGGRER